MEPGLKARALLLLAEEMDLKKARARLPEIKASEWRRLFREAAFFFEPDEKPRPEKTREVRPGRPVLFVDGASRGNPGPAAAGGVVYLGDERVAQLSEALGVMTNNQAEYEALIRGLKIVARLGFREVMIQSDSQLVVRQIQGRYRVKDPKLKPLFARVQAALKSLEGYDIIHIDRSLNQEADSLANQALDAKGV